MPRKTENTKWKKVAVQNYKTEKKRCNDIINPF